MNLPINIYYPGSSTKPVVVISWTEPNLPTIFLNSHMDVVSVYAEQWTHLPFGAEIDADGRIFGRGTQDMKSYGMQYLSAIYSLKSMGVINKRTVNVVFVPGTIYYINL